ncbi:murein hydrolase activator EnvC family protein [Chitinophaga sp. GCM10012297]|uniref:Peptidoglycan DD-metalloendopeptidase family protein n=1 Tax=Chitinophaga chungangae TaxID=2821488 RepID=A0ABS3YFF7_9BACT|nr:peptidoglycan DD-metalloendopeptidase family protein [Chitinophaga chungangae]MBO9153411.1 peptidoglycan DD-metalloendopeptidase family protein [Chitinophaga chungangae]
MKKFIPVLLLALVFLPVMLHAQNQSREELEKRKRELQKEMEEAQAILRETKKSSKESLAQLRAVRNKIDVRSKMIRNINDEIKFINGDINSALRDVKTLQSDLDTLKAQYAQLIVAAYKNRSSYALMNFIFSADSFNEAVKRYQYLKQYRDFRRRQADNIIETQAQLQLKVKNLQDQRVKRSATLKTEQEERSTLEKDRKEKDEVVAKLKGREKELLADISQKQKDQKKIQDLIRAVIRKEIEAARRKEAEELARRKAAEAAERKRREEERQRALAAAKEAAAKAAASNNAGNNTAAATQPAAPVPPPPKPEPAEPEKPTRVYNVLEASPEAAALGEKFEDNRGKLPWPVESGMIIGWFGKQRNADMERVVEENDGMIFATRKGGNVKAIFEGEVRVVMAIPGGGYSILVKHGQYFTNYVGLLSFNVKSGQKISTGQVIGTAKSNEEQSAGVIEVQIYKLDKLQNANQWIKPR